jgi:hypothetical protein
MSGQLWGGALAPATPPTEAAASCRGLCRTWYGFSREHWRARADLNRSSKPASKVVAAALPPVKHKLRESRKYVRHYVAAQKARAPAECYLHQTHANIFLARAPSTSVLSQQSAGLLG